MNEICKSWYERSYKHEGFSAQRMYPNEELCRYMGRSFFKIPRGHRHEYKILEVGCGSCANLWMIAAEGFDAYGCDLSEESIKLGEQMLKHWGKEAHLSIGDMTKMSYQDCSFNSVIDVFSSYCLAEGDYAQFLSEVRRVLIQGGSFFSYTPSKSSDAFKNYGPATLIDNSTLDGIRRDDSPFCGNHYPFRFMDVQDMRKILQETGFELKYSETITKTYNNMSEKFEWISFEATKIS